MRKLQSLSIFLFGTMVSSVLSMPIVMAADTTAPVISSGSPSGTLDAGTTNATLSITTDEAASCRYSTTMGVSYDSMTDSFTDFGDTYNSHTAVISGLVDGASYIYYVRCADGSGNKNTSDYPISFNINSGTDTFAPTISNAIPTGSLAAGTTSTTMSVNTSEDATCRYSLSSGVNYTSMPYTFSTTGGTSHAVTLNNLTDSSYNFYVRCMDGENNINTSDYLVSFVVLSSPLVANFHANQYYGNNPLNVQFYDDSLGNVTSWAWDFDNDGTIDSNQQNPSYTYSTPGVYSVSLTISNNSELDAITRHDYIVVKDSSSTDTYLHVVKGGNGAGTVESSNVVGISCGLDCYQTYATGSLVILSATPNVGSAFSHWTIYSGTTSDTYSGSTLLLSLDADINVVANFNNATSLTADFSASATSGAAYFPVRFIDTSTGNPATWEWDFDNDGVIDSTAQNPEHLYTSPGTYAVRLVVTNGTLSDQEIKTGYITVTDNTSMTTTGSTAVSSRYRGMGGGNNDRRFGDYDPNNRNAGYFGAPYINTTTVKTRVLQVPSLCGVPEDHYVTHNLYNLIARSTGLPVQCSQNISLVPQSLMLGRRDICF